MSDQNVQRAVNLIFAAHRGNSPFGGSTSYLSHLFWSLSRRKVDVRVLCVRRRSETKLRWMRVGAAGSVPYQNLSLQDTVASVRAVPSVITYAYWRQEAETVTALLSQGKTGIVVHDPAEFHQELFDLLRAENIRPAVIRRSNQATLRKQGLRAVLLLHPYVSLNPPSMSRAHLACTATRLDFRKHTEIIVAANQKLRAKQRVHIYGDPNRVMVHHLLDPRFPNWSRDFRGPFSRAPHAAVRVQQPYRFAIDLTDIKGDGGGTQYSFLEAWDAGCVVIAHTNWFNVRARDSEICKGQHALSVSSVKELVSLLQHPPPAQRCAQLQEASREILRSHSGPQPVLAFMRYAEDHTVKGT